jgi:hypothetical protein
MALSLAGTDRAPEASSLSASLLDRPELEPGVRCCDRAPVTEEGCTLWRRDGEVSGVWKMLEGVTGCDLRAT